MYDTKAWAEPGGGMHGGMSSAATNCSEKHHPVADGWAPPRRMTDGWGAKKWPQKGSHYHKGKSNSVSLVTKFGRAPAKKGTPEELKPGCWRGKCKFPHGEDARDDLLHGLPYDGLPVAFYLSPPPPTPSLSPPPIPRLPCSLSLSLSLRTPTTT